MPSVEQIVDQLGSSDQVKAYQARQALVKLTSEAGAPGNNQRREELAAALAKALSQTK